MGSRDTTSVVQSHLGLRRAGDIEGDIAINYSPDVVLLTGTGMYRGHDGVRHTAKELDEYLGEGTYEYRNVLIEGRMGFLEWWAGGLSGQVRDGADSFLVEEGLIVFQTIHYTVDGTPRH